MSRRLTFILALFSSAFYILSFPNFNQTWLVWIALVPLILAVSPAHRHSGSPTRAFLTGWLAGTVAYVGILFWLIATFNAAHLSTGLAGLCLVLLAGYLGLYWGIWAWFTQKCQTPFGPFIGAAAWVALEYLRTYLFSGFPWALLGDSQVKVLPIIQIASITGVYGISFIVVTINLSLATLILHVKQSNTTHFWGQSPMMRYIALWGLSPAVLLICFFWGEHRMSQEVLSQKGKTLSVALLQGNVDQYKKWDKAYVSDIQKTYETLVLEAAKTKPDLIVWPETSVPGYLLQDLPLRTWLEKTIRESHTENLVGAPVINNEVAYNTSFSINAGGDVEGEYAKQHLVPFGEIVPWANVLGHLIHVLNDLGGFAAGTSSEPLLVAGTKVGVNICYEAIFPNLVRQSVAQGATFIANVTNDGWYMKTAAPYQHWAPNIFRAIENDRWLVRADNTGISGIIDPTGRVVTASSIFTSDVVSGTIELRTTHTFYTRAGDLFAWMCCGVCLLSFVL